jgi:putative FmdB family regulatory protein
VPTYQYVCTECGHDFETVQSFSDDALSVCPVCGGRLRKVFNSVGIVFKGSGFYRNDSREKTSSGAGKKDAKTDATSGAKADLKPDAKPAKTDAASTKPAKSGDSSSSSSGGGSSSSGSGSSTSGGSSTKGSAA